MQAFFLFFFLNMFPVIQTVAEIPEGIYFGCNSVHISKCVCVCVYSVIFKVV